MAMRKLSAGPRPLVGFLALALGTASSTAWAGDKHKPVLYYLPQQAPAATYSAPAVVTYAAPVATFSAPAAAVFSAPTAYTGMVGSTYSAPAPTYVQATAAVGNAPTAAVVGSRIMAADRADLLEDARASLKSEPPTGTRMERRKSLRESVTKMYADAIGGEEDSSLNESEEQDVEAIVNWLLESKGAGAVEAAPYVVSNAPVQAPFVYQQAPTTVYTQQAPTMYLQPMTPVQFLVPVQPKHGFFHR
ncbi:hypothetical protein [Paludisphaera soli]|uniref:hypothetical protein n=1 Tax=Paludisphaera soli TaxID=2712865 RepID=UPI0013EA86B4|nr:hypothetical protein [Paludisphaera soli]